MSAQETRTAIRQALGEFAKRPAADAAAVLLSTLGYRSDRCLPVVPNTAANFVDTLAPGRTINEAAALFEDWTAADFLFQFTVEDIRQSPQLELSLCAESSWDPSNWASFLFVAVSLRGDRYTRTQLARVTREINRLFLQPVLVFFRHGETLTLAAIQRRLHKREASRDVLERVTLVKDIRCSDPHRAHVEILADLSLGSLHARFSFTSFEGLHAAWQKTLDSSELNKRFYQELANWYFWALSEVRFPADAPKDKDGRESLSLIRLITRLIFCWFLKEKGLIPEVLFRPQRLSAFLDLSDPHQSTYYKAVLQNLFFATLNTEMDVPGEAPNRRFVQKGYAGYMVHSAFHHEELIKDHETFLNLFQRVPFLNGGLFECLDEPGEKGEIRIDGFSSKPKKQPHVPDFLFFGEDRKVDLSGEYGELRYSQASVRPLISLLDHYKFTVAENTPLEEEVALDPELLGHVFENLLAAYNPETGAVARKTTGSFYTPRSVVDFMVDESLVTYLGSRLGEKCPGCADGEFRLRRLLAYTDAPHDFGLEEVSVLVEAIDEVRILDPACGSGAFPMGALHKLVTLLQKLDPGNAAWKARQVANADRLDLGRDAAFAAIEEAFARDQGDYARKLYLIENCLYGVDIQPIAVQIAKLRCFVSLVVEQEPDDTLPNRGILPLPNLETNFVAANTLLGLQRLGQLALRDRTIDEKEEELRRVRRRHFLAKRWPQKKELRARDKELRQELATLLETSQTLSGPEAKRLAGWDPYHADLWADFFDAEWMFSLRRGFDIVLGNPPYVRQEEIKELKPRFKGDYFCYTGTADLYVYFFEKAFDLLRPSGVLCFISSNKYFRSGYGEKLRRFLAENGDVRLVIDFGDAPVFTAIAYPSIVLVRKTRETREKAKLSSKKAAPPRTPSAASNVKVLRWEPGPTIEEFPEVFRDKAFELSQNELTPAGWRLERPIKLALLEKLRGAGTPLGEYVAGKFYYGVKTGLNEAFVVDRTTRDRLIAEHPSSADVLKPYLRGREIKRWQILSQDLWLIFIPWHFPLHGDPTIQGASIVAEEEFERKYPAVFNHLNRFRPALAARAEAETGIRYEWYALQRWRPEYWKEFRKTKIVYPDIYERQSFAWDDSGLFLANTCYFVPTTEQWLMGLFNSLVVEWFYGLISNRVRGGYLRAFTDYMKQVPIPKIGKAAQELIESEVRMILDTKRQDPGAPVGDLEARIEGTVAHLYGLTEDEFSAILNDLDLADPLRLGALNAYRETAKELGR